MHTTCFRESQINHCLNVVSVQPCRAHPNFSLPADHQDSRLFVSFNRVLFCAFADLEDASPTHKPPCNAEKKCKNAYKQNLGGCDAASGQCVCAQGYVLSNDICTGRNRRLFCASIIHTCPIPFRTFPSLYFSCHVCVINYGSQCLEKCACFQTFQIHSLIKHVQ